jgi:hypothetical protein
MGYAVGGDGTNGAKPLVIRAAGRSLGALGVSGTVSEPKMDFFVGATRSGGNDDWGGGADIATAMAGVGAFALSAPASAFTLAMLFAPPPRCRQLRDFQLGSQLASPSPNNESNTHHLRIDGCLIGSLFRVRRSDRRL